MSGSERKGLPLFIEPVVERAQRPIAYTDEIARFDSSLQEAGRAPLLRQLPATLQINVGKVCNQACHHCHVDAGPKRSEQMGARVLERVLELLERSPCIEVVDVTGGAPELNPHFAELVRSARNSGRRVIDRCNLTILSERGFESLPEFLAANGVAVIASLPCYGPDNVDAQRGKGVFEKSIAGLSRLNALGYGAPGSSLELDLVYNPGGASLPPDQAQLERRYKDELRQNFGIAFNRLFTLANMPIARFARALERQNAYSAYMSLLVNHFNPATVPGLMCRSLVSVSYDGRLYDCDFNQMLELPLGSGQRSIWDLLSFQELQSGRINTGLHCYGCTAGAGSSCTGALE